MSISMKVKSKTLGILSKINQKNLDKSLKLLDKGLKQFSKIIDSFGKSMDAVTKEFSSDIKKSKNQAKDREIINKQHLSKIFNSNVKLWSDKGGF